MITKKEYEGAVVLAERLKLAHEAGVNDKVFVSLAIDCAKAVVPQNTEQPSSNSLICLKTIEVAEKYSRNEVTFADCVLAAQEAFNISNNFLRIASSTPGWSGDSLDSLAIDSAATAAYAATGIGGSPLSSAVEVVRNILEFERFNTSEVVDVEEILNRYVSWNDVLTAQIAAAAKSHKFTQKKIIQKIRLLSEEERSALFQYTETILACDDLAKEFRFLMKDYYERKIK